MQTAPNSTLFASAADPDGAKDSGKDSGNRYGRPEIFYGHIDVFECWADAEVHRINARCGMDS
jgi:hypothetical protein